MNKMLNRAAVLVLTAVMTVTCVPAIQVQAADNQPLHTTVTTSGKGDDMQLTYQLTMDKTVVSDGRLAILYDANVLELTKDSEANLFTEKDVNKNYTSGEKKGIAIAFINDSAKKSGGRVATLKFNVVDGLDAQDTTIQTQVFGINNEAETVVAEGVMEDVVNVGNKPLEKPQMKALEQTLLGVNVTWNKLEGADGYEVYRSLAGGSYKKVATVKDQDYWDVLIANKKNYTYKIRAYQGNGKDRVYSEYSDVLSIQVKKFQLFR